jgi:hypothetical protein
MISKFSVFLASTALFAGGVSMAQPAASAKPAEGQVTSEQISPAVVASAVAAVAKLGEEVVLGRYHVAVDRMNPLWKERTAQRMGGMKELERKLADVPQEMVKQGISMISFKPNGQPRAYEVSPGTAQVTENGVPVQKLVYTKWLVMVPTMTKFRIIRQGNPKPLIIDSTSFQVAISDKGSNDWTFIDGAGLKPSDLRSLFITLPQDIELPPVEKHESR